MENTTPGSAESAIREPNLPKEHKPKRAPRKPAAKAAGEAGAKTSKAERMHWITLHDSKEIPPNGQFIGVNGRQFILKPGIKTQVPECVLEVLDNAVQALPEVNEKLQVVGMRNAPRLPYSHHRDVA